MLALIAVVTISCGEASPAASPTTGSPTESSYTIEEVYERVEQVLDQPEMLYHATITTEYDDPGTGTTTRPGLVTERWVDPSNNLVREEVSEGVNRWTTIRTVDGQYTLDVDQISVTQPPPCPGGTLSAAAILTCPNAGYTTWVFPTPGSVAVYEEVQATPVVTIENDQYEGRAAVVVVSVIDKVEYRVGDVTETTRLFLDPETFLPFATEHDRRCCGSTETVRELSTVTHEFVPADSVPAGFFDPATLRNLRPDPETTLNESPPGYSLYWLGSRFAGNDALPPLVLWHVDRYHQQDWPEGADQIMLDYTREDDPFPQAPVVRLTEYTRQVWDSLAASAGPDGPCWTTQDMPLPDGHATLFLGFTWPDSVPPSPDNCPADRTPDRFVAYAYLGDTVVVVDYPSDSLAALEEVVRALVPREPPSQ